MPFGRVREHGVCVCVCVCRKEYEHILHRGFFWPHAALTWVSWPVVSARLCSVAGFFIPRQVCRAAKERGRVGFMTEDLVPGKDDNVYLEAP